MMKEESDGEEIYYNEWEKLVKRTVIAHPRIGIRIVKKPYRKRKVQDVQKEKATTPNTTTEKVLPPQQQNGTVQSEASTLICGYSILCYSCSSLVELENCETVTCPDGFQCSATKTENQDVVPPQTGQTSSMNTTGEGNLLIQDFERKCLPQFRCNFLGSYTIDKVRTWMTTTCCDTDLCVAPEPEVIKTDYNANGVMCPTCSSPTGDCGLENTTKTMACQGQEFSCVLYLYNFTDPRYIYTLFQRGCATDSYCDFSINISMFVGTVNLVATNMSMNTVTGEETYTVNINEMYTCSGSVKEIPAFYLTVVFFISFLFFFI
ncbi:uncharacterized protein [Hyperolius riggenbachi]|uniref:uncharacterized protein n=1 Tax=Hyperolius riggenbachi TaxID=752182 RepID=UPI0035A2C965